MSKFEKTPFKEKNEIVGGWRISSRASLHRKNTKNLQKTKFHKLVVSICEALSLESKLNATRKTQNLNTKFLKISLFCFITLFIA